MNRCKDCKHFTGAGDWDLCCTVDHPTIEEKNNGHTFPFGHICFDTTPACDMFDGREYSE